MQSPIPERPVAAPQKRSRLTVFLAAVLLMTGAAVLLMLPTGRIGLVMVFGGILFFGVIGFHYFVWGRWMDRILRQEREEQERTSDVEPSVPRQEVR